MEELFERVTKSMLAMQRYPWEQGVCAQALYEAGRDDIWIPMAYDAIKRMDNAGRLAMAGCSDAVSDPASNGEVCFRAYEKTHDVFFLDGAKRMLSYLLECAPRTEDGIICHNNVSYHEGYSRYQIWIDGLYMVPPFLAVMGEMDESMKQIRGFIRHLYDAENSLFFHIKDVACDKYIRKVHWATGNGWALMGLSRVIEEAQSRGRSDILNELIPFLNGLLTGMLRFAQDDGRFRDILDDETSFIDGTSSMMMAATVYRGIVGGYVSSEIIDVAERAFKAVSDSVDEYGILHHVCGCPDFVEEGTSAEAQAAYIMSTAWRLRVLNIC